MTLRKQIFEGSEPIRFGGPLAAATGLLLILGAFCAWASVAQLEEQIHAAGSFIASSRSQVVQAVDGGAIVELRVREGGAVEAGQVIAVLDPTRSQASNDEAAAKAASLEANIARLRAEVLGTAIEFPPHIALDAGIVQGQRNLMDQRQRALREDIASMQASLTLARQELDAYERLATTGDASESELLKARRQASELQGQITSRRNKYLQEAQAELTKARDDYAQAKQQLSQRSAVLASTQIRAPMKGVVKNIRVTTIGGVLKPGEELLEIVPNDDSLIVEAKVRTSDVAFLRLGLPSNIKIDSYDYTIYGSIRGKVRYISPDTLTEESRQGQITYYRVQIETLDPHPQTLKGTPFEIIPGMVANVDIRTGQKTVANYLLKPLRKAANESLTER
ncbi:adhesin transport system membrane fusion protein [Panacagrimonas perspica]|uniref:Membrane fusion protein (MFP) family protein n=1 Tax=Panacagrimonas perspica TaxID=381431 RepID=A0A4S3K3E8_9GAMM|nr:HlyD family type I secretion periplasmic adaptor subunit [Panacagrimonas perspica]TDU31195.1 adhesin transport system membrane fusion protein [Panacagrimonas perspica]THD02552.1 hypothetical protein B1810_13420 [Panacagrimonas perspica]